MKDYRPVIIPAIIILILAFGTIGFHIVQPEYTILDSLYMTVITVTTIGYGEVRPLTSQGKIFDLALIGLGWVGIFISARMAGQMLIESEIAKNYGRRKMDKHLASLANHYIVCGFGRVGKVVCEEFGRHKMQFVVIERDPQIAGEIKLRGFPFVEGNCIEDDNLLKAGIARARGLINAIPDGADAVYTTLSARQHNPRLFIMARADSPSVEQMLRRAGADRVISPQAAAGARMAMAALRPNVVDFISLASFAEDGGVRVEEVIVNAGCRLDGKSFKEVEIRAKYGLNVIGIKKPDGKIIYNPTADYVVQPADILIMVGGGEQLSKIDELLRPCGD